MSFEPLRTDSRRSLGVRFGFAVKRSNASGSARLRLSICSELMSKAGVHDGDLLRLEVDATQGLGRLVRVIVQGEAVRRVEVRSQETGRGHWELPWSGEVPRFFPISEFMAELEVIEVKSGELTFATPGSVKPETTTTTNEGGMRR